MSKTPYTDRLRADGYKFRNKDGRRYLVSPDNRSWIEHSCIKTQDEIETLPPGIDLFYRVYTGPVMFGSEFFVCVTGATNFDDSRQKAWEAAHCLGEKFKTGVHKVYVVLPSGREIKV